MDERGIPRHGYELVYGGAVVGTVTSGSQSPILQKGIGLGYVSDEPHLTAVNAPIGVLVRGRALAAHVARPPFHKN
jgi:aminomethyltransferase